MSTNCGTIWADGENMLIWGHIDVSKGLILHWTVCNLSEQVDSKGDYLYNGAIAVVPPLCLPLWN